MKNRRYPGVEEAERIKKGTVSRDEEPDFIGNAPNYDKFAGWDTEKVLVWLNID